MRQALLRLCVWTVADAGGGEPPCLRDVNAGRAARGTGTGHLRAPPCRTRCGNQNTSVRNKHTTAVFSFTPLTGRPSDPAADRGQERARPHVVPANRVLLRPVWVGARGQTLLRPGPAGAPDHPDHPRHRTPPALPPLGLSSANVSSARVPLDAERRGGGKARRR